MDGHAAARAIRALPDEERRNVPIIAMTANAFEEDVLAAKEAGMDAYVSKPVDVKSLLAAIEAVMRNAE
jgi:CheY-like chemotaxis protein